MHQQLPRPGVQERVSIRNTSYDLVFPGSSELVVGALATDLELPSIEASIIGQFNIGGPTNVGSKSSVVH